MNKYKCKSCDEFHEIVTLFEFPQPDIISEITSGKLKQELSLVAKNFFMIDKEKVFIQSELSINILNLEDELDMLVWVIFEIKDYLEKVENLKGTNKFKISGILSHDLPFYKNTVELPVEIELDLKGYINDQPKVVSILRKNQFQKDFQNGIDLPDFEILLSKIYHQ